MIREFGSYTAAATAVIAAFEQIRRASVAGALAHEHPPSAGLNGEFVIEGRRRPLVRQVVAYASVAAILSVILLFLDKPDPAAAIVGVVFLCASLALIAIEDAFVAPRYRLGVTASGLVCRSQWARSVRKLAWEDIARIRSDRRFAIVIEPSDPARGRIRVPFGLPGRAELLNALEANTPERVWDSSFREQLEGTVAFRRERPISPRLMRSNRSG